MMMEAKKCYLTWMIFFNLALSALYANPYEEKDDTYCPPSCCRAGHFFVRGDVLYWTPRISGLELNFGTSSITKEIVDDTEIFTTREVDLDPHFKWNAGYRVGLGYAHTCWEVGALWTHFQSHGRRSHCQHLDFTNAGRIKVKLDQIDLVFGCPSSYSDLFLIKPFLGIRGTSIHEDLHALLFTNIFLSSNAEVLETRKFYDKQKYSGVGPLLGVHGDWEIGCGFGIYGTAAAGILYGDYKAHFHDEAIFTSSVSKQFFSRNKRHVHAFDCNIDLALGFSWHTCLCNRFELEAKLGFEHHQYFNQNRLSVCRGDVTFTGGVFSLQIGF